MLILSLFLITFIVILIICCLCKNKNISYSIQDKNVKEKNIRGDKVDSSLVYIYEPIQMEEEIELINGVYWVNFEEDSPIIGVTSPLNLQSNSTLDVLITNPAPVTFGDGGTVGQTETGLNYFSSFFSYTTRSSGSTSGGPFSFDFTNFQIDPVTHIRGILFVGDLFNSSVPVTIATTPPPSSPITQIGDQFGSTSNASLTITPNSNGATITRVPSGAQNSKGIFVDLGSLTQYTRVIISHNKFRSDFVSWAFGQEVSIPLL